MSYFRGQKNNTKIVSGILQIINNSNILELENQNHEEHSRVLQSKLDQYKEALGSESYLLDRKNLEYSNFSFGMYGDFKNNILHGQGETLTADLVFTKGRFEHGQIEGDGIRIFPNSLIYEGQFKQDSIHQEGKFSFLPNMEQKIKQREVEGID